MSPAKLRGSIARLHSSTGTTSQQIGVDGHAAYADGPGYTSPEMRPGNGENLSALADHTTGGLAAAMGMPAVGAMLATEGLLGQREEPIQAGPAREPMAPEIPATAPTVGRVRHLPAFVSRRAVRQADR